LKKYLKSEKKQVPSASFFYSFGAWFSKDFTCIVMTNLKLPARHSQSTLLWILLCGILFSNCQKSDDPINIPDPDEEIREILWNQPYSSRSIWNMPIHKNAEYQFIGDDFYHHNKYVDDVYIAYVSPDDPVVRLKADCEQRTIK
jgi:hypothetical protein